MIRKEEMEIEQCKLIGEGNRKRDARRKYGEVYMEKLKLSDS